MHAEALLNEALLNEALLLAFWLNDCRMPSEHEFLRWSTVARHNLMNGGLCEE